MLEELKSASSCNAGVSGDEFMFEASGVAGPVTSCNWLEGAADDVCACAFCGVDAMDEMTAAAMRHSFPMVMACRAVDFRNITTIWSCCVRNRVALSRSSPKKNCYVGFARVHDSLRRIQFAAVNIWKSRL